MANVMEMCEAVKDYVIEMRRELHKIPELGINNPKTKDFICAQLDEMGIPYQLNTVIHDGVQDTSVVGFIQGKNTDKVLALRTDVDALPVNETTSPPTPARCTPAGTTTTAPCCWAPPRYSRR